MNKEDIFKLYEKYAALNLNAQAHDVLKLFVQDVLKELESKDKEVPQNDSKNDNKDGKE